MIGRPITVIIPADRPTEEPEILRRLQRGERIDHFETVRVTKDGRRIDVSLMISPLRDQDGRITGASKIARDITLQKNMERARAQSEEALRESEERFRAMFQQTAAGIAQMDLSGRFLMVNARYGQVLGRTPEELRGMRIHDVIHPDDLPTHRPLMER